MERERLDGEKGQDRILKQIEKHWRIGERGQQQGDDTRRVLRGV